MKVYISVDVEGVAGVASWPQMMAGIDASFDAALFVGYHARGAARGLARASSVAPFTPSLPLRLEVAFGSPERADEAATLPRAERLDACTVAYTAADGLEAWRAFYTFMALAAYAG